MMEEARKLDHLLLELRSATGRIKVDNLVAMHPLASVQRERHELLNTLVQDNLVNCSSEVIEIESEVWITEEGQQFLANGGYRKRKTPDFNKENKNKGDRLKQILIYGLPILVLIILLLILFGAT